MHFSDLIKLGLLSMTALCGSRKFISDEGGAERLTV